MKLLQDISLSQDKQLLAHSNNKTISPPNPIIYNTFYKIVGKEILENLSHDHVEKLKYFHLVFLQQINHSLSAKIQGQNVIPVLLPLLEDCFKHYKLKYCKGLLLCLSEFVTWLKSDNQAKQIVTTLVEITE